MITDKVLLAIAPKAKHVSALIEAMNTYFPEYEINTKLREAHFLAQAAHETEGFIYDHEIWGPTAAQKRYEGNKSLGNIHKGDGKKYLGRGIFQLTGRANYQEYGEALGLPLEEKPELATTPDIAVRIACQYWVDYDLNEYADKDDIVIITKCINGGLNGLEDRKHYLKKAKDAL